MMMYQRVVVRGVLLEGAGGLHAEVAGGLEAEGRDAGGQREIVVDGLRHVGDFDSPLRVFVNLAAAVGGVVTADADQILHAEVAERFEHVRHVRGVFGGVGPAGAEHRSAAVEVGCDIVDGEDLDLGRVTLDEVLVTVADAEDFDAAIDGFDGHGRDHAVDAGGGAAADEDGQAVAGRGFDCHARRSKC